MSRVAPEIDLRFCGYIKEAVRWAMENGVIKGTPPATLRSAVYATCAQIVVILVRYGRSEEK